MKHLLTFLMVMALFPMAMHAQVKAVMWNGDSQIMESAILSITTDCDTVYINTDDGTLSYVIQDLKCIQWAENPSAINEVAEDDAQIIYNPETEVVSVAGAADDSGHIMLMNAEGKLIKIGKGAQLSVTGLPAGIYIVNWNGKLSAKFKKQ